MADMKWLKDIANAEQERLNDYCGYAWAIRHCKGNVIRLTVNYLDGTVFKIVKRSYDGDDFLVINAIDSDYHAIISYGADKYCDERNYENAIKTAVLNVVRAFNYYW